MKMQAAYLMAASCVLEEHAIHTPEYDPALSLADKRLREARGVESEMEALPLELSDFKARICSRILEFDLAVRKGDSEAAEAAVANAKELPAIAPEHFMKMARMCRGKDTNANKKI